MDNVTVYIETAYNSSNSSSSTRNLNKNRKKSLKYEGVRDHGASGFRQQRLLLSKRGTT